MVTTAATVVIDDHERPLDLSTKAGRLLAESAALIHARAKRRRADRQPRMSDPADPQRFATLIEALGAYRMARHALLDALSLPASNRDPPTEFSEHLVQSLLGGELAVSRGAGELGP